MVVTVSEHPATDHPQGSPPRLNAVYPKRLSEDLSTRVASPDADRQEALFRSLNGDQTMKGCCCVDGLLNILRALRVTDECGTIISHVPLLRLCPLIHCA